MFIVNHFHKGYYEHLIPNYLFDADGTLIDTAELIYQSFVYSCKTFAQVIVRSVSSKKMKQEVM